STGFLGEEGALESIPGVGFELRRAGFWTFKAGAEAKIGADSSLTLVYEKSIPMMIGARTSPDVVFPTTQDEPGRPVAWCDPKPDWWTLDAMYSYALAPEFGLVGGLRLDHFLLELRSSGISGIQPEPDETILRYSGDLYQKLIEPYIGLRMKSADFTVTVIGSPVVFGKFGLLFKHAEAEGAEQELAVDRFSFQQAKPFFVEASLDWRKRFSDGMVIDSWFKGSWLNASMKTNREASEIESTEAEAQSGQGRGFFRKALLGGGIEARIRF
ncbi:MAG: hypothetical protein V2B18_25985, partial [Pseudomonadota bacterium]